MNFSSVAPVLAKIVKPKSKRRRASCTSAQDIPASRCRPSTELTLCILRKNTRVCTHTIHHEHIHTCSRRVSASGNVFIHLCKYVQLEIGTFSLHITCKIFATFPPSVTGSSSYSTKRTYFHHSLARSLFVNLQMDKSCSSDSPSKDKEDSSVCASSTIHLPLNVVQRLSRPFRAFVVTLWS